MYSQNIFVSTRLIECILIVGVKHIELQRKIIFIYKILKKIIELRNFKSKDTSIKPEILYTIPKNYKMNNSSLSIMFPQDFEISNEEKPPKIYSNVLTNEKGISSYLYILLIIYQKNLNYYYKIK